MVVVLLIVAI